jgi:hypothetical protein
MSDLWIVLALLVGVLVSGRVIFLLTHHVQKFKAIDFVTLGAVAFVALAGALAATFLIFYSIAGGGER